MSFLSRLGRWRAFMPLLGRRFTDPHAITPDFDFYEWSKRFQWEYRGLTYEIPSVAHIIDEAQGDCQEYAMVAASVLRNRGEPVEYAMLWAKWNPVPMHVVAISNDHVYSSGEIFSGHFIEFMRHYNWVRVWRCEA